MSESHTVYRSCPFCEATCGLAVEVADGRILRVRGDRDDVFSRGFICPKAHGLKETHEDPDRLTTPMQKTASGFEPIGWDEAFVLIHERLAGIREAHGNDAVGVYAGNPLVVHDLAFLYLPVLAQALGSRNVFNPGSIDTLPRDVQTGLMYGGSLPVLSVTIPDLERTDHLLVIGANPMISHGSLMTVPNAPGRLKDLRKRGGRVVVIDPRRSETAHMADEHHFIRPGADGALLLAMVHTLFDEDRVTLGAATGLVNGLDDVQQAVAAYTPERVAGFCGISAREIRRLALDFADAESAACYGRLGTCTQPFGTLASWGIDLLNILTGNLDRPGGVMFPSPAASYRTLGDDTPFEFGRWASRVSGLPESTNMLPVSALAEEILTPGDGQIHAMIVLMANAVRTTPNSVAMERAFRALDFFVAVDCYINETTHHADLILPTPSHAEQSHYDFGPYHLSVRNVVNYSAAPLPAAPDSLAAWEVMLKLSAPLMGLGDAPIDAVDDAVFSQIAQNALMKSTLDGITLDEVMAGLAGQRGPERIIDLLIRLGEHGDGFGRRADGLTLEAIAAQPHGIDLGPLRPRLNEVLSTASGKIELGPGAILVDLPRLDAAIADGEHGFSLIGRRLLRSANTALANVPLAQKNGDECSLLMARSDAERLGVAAGQRVKVSGRSGSVEVAVEPSDDMMPGVVSLPHGFGHDDDASQLRVAARQPGVNANALTDDAFVDGPSGAAVLSGVPVSIEV